MARADKSQIFTVTEGFLADFLNTLVKYHAGYVASAGKGLGANGVVFFGNNDLTAKLQRLNPLLGKGDNARGRLGGTDGIANDTG